MDDRIKALTICNPYPALILDPRTTNGQPKLCENRPTRYSHRGPLLIHAGKSRQWMPYINELADLCSREFILGPDEFVTFSAIVGVVEVIDSLPLKEYLIKYPGDPWAFGPYCLRLANPRLFTRPIPFKGAQGLWRVSYEYVREALAEVTA
jgi:hypothetical protein